MVFGVTAAHEDDRQRISGWHGEGKHALGAGVFCHIGLDRVFFLVQASSAVTVLVDHREHDVCVGVNGIAAAAEDATDDCEDYREQQGYDP